MKITELYIYPIKSLYPLSVKSTRLRREGLEHDRRFMLLKVQDDGTYKNIQTAYFPECTLFHQSLDGDDIVVTYHIPKEPLFPPVPEQRTPLRVPLSPRTDGLKTVHVRLLGSDTPAYRMGSKYDTWFSACFGYATTLVYIGDQGREVLAHAPPPPPEKQGGRWLSSITSFLPGTSNGDDTRGKQKSQLVFNEAAPFLLTSRASLRDVSARLPGDETMDMMRFRPNIVVDPSLPPSPPSSASPSQGAGAPSSSDHQETLQQPWDEDFWAEVAIHHDAGTTPGASPPATRIALTANCARCISINIDYDAGRPAHGEAGTVLKKLMRDRRVDAGNKWSPIFGRYAFLQADDEAGGGGQEKESGGEAQQAVEIAVGDEVTVTRRIVDRDVWVWPNT
ncbi:MOSC domain-containing protein [Xylariaceae sp. FL0016]|nr:MOSC domain-containing protein [Xylariaceae sp. FL0016]